MSTTPKFRTLIATALGNESVRAEIKVIDTRLRADDKQGRRVLYQKRKPSKEGNYIVQEGDSLWKLAKKFNTTVDELARLNNIDDANRGNIYAEEKLWVPEVPAVTEKSLFDGNNSLFDITVARDKTIVVIPEFIKYDPERHPPLYMIDKSGKLTKPVVSLFNAAFNYNKVAMEASTWSYYKKSRFGKFWFWMTQYPGATVSGKDVYYDEQKLTDAQWLGLISHEESHRQEVHSQGNVSFYTQYLREGLVTPYEKISTEVTAYRIGANPTKTDLTHKLTQYKDGIVLSILQNENLTESEKSSQLRIIGLQFRLDEMITPTLMEIDKEIKNYQEELRTADINTYRGIQERLNFLIKLKQLSETVRDQINKEVK